MLLFKFYKTFKEQFNTIAINHTKYFSHCVVLDFLQGLNKSFRTTHPSTYPCLLLYNCPLPVSLSREIWKKLFFPKRICTRMCIWLSECMRDNLQPTNMEDVTVFAWVRPTDQPMYIFVQPRKLGENMKNHTQTHPTRTKAIANYMCEYFSRTHRE